MASTCLIMLLACSSLGSEEDVILNELTSEYVPAELWLENGRQLISQKESSSNQRTFFAELSQSDSQIEITLDANNEVTKVSVPLKTGMTKILYFDYDRLCFSKTVEDGSETLFSAYADSRAYAHSLANGEEPTAARIREISLDKQMLESIISLAVSFSSREKRATHNFRISDRETLIADTVNLGMDFIAKMNVQKGEEIDIRLLSNEPHIYFTLTPGVGSNMEHKFWNGPAPFNGDVQIRVFAAEDIDDGRFRLSVKKY